MDQGRTSWIPRSQISCNGKSMTIVSSYQPYRREETSPIKTDISWQWLIFNMTTTFEISVIIIQKSTSLSTTKQFQCLNKFVLSVKLLNDFVYYYFIIYNSLWSAIRDSERIIVAKQGHIHPLAPSLCSLMTSVILSTTCWHSKALRDHTYTHFPL